MKIGDKVVFVQRDRHFQPRWWSAGEIVGRRDDHWVISCHDRIRDCPKYEVFPYPLNRQDWDKLPQLHRRFDSFK
jgi:hypothetical protein